MGKVEYSIRIRNGRKKYEPAGLTQGMSEYWLPEALAMTYQCIADIEHSRLPAVRVRITFQLQRNKVPKLGNCWSRRWILLRSDNTPLVAYEFLIKIYLGQHRLPPKKNDYHPAHTVAHEFGHVRDCLEDGERYFVRADQRQERKALKNAQEQYAERYALRQMRIFRKHFK